MRIYIKYKKETEEKLDKKYGKKISIVSKTAYFTENDKEIKKKVLDVKFKNVDILDRTEIDMFNYINKNYKILEIVRLSRKFIDLHKVEKEKNFLKALEKVQSKMKPIYVRKNKYWWVGVEKLHNPIKIEDLVKEFYRIGLGMGLVPSDFVNKE